MSGQSPARSISIVIACRNEAKHIARFLDSVFSQDFAGMEWEVVVADGMSNDGTRDILENYRARHKQLVVIDNPGRFVAAGLNAAIGASRGEFILRMDAHTTYASDYCRLCVATLIEKAADNAGGPARTEARGTRAKAIAAAYHSPFSTGGGRFHDERHEGWVDTVPYGCWRRELFDRIGLFDESLVRNQDDEFNLRLIRAGGRIWQNPRIISFYSPRATLRSLFHQYFQYGFWKVAVIRKHRLPGSWRHLVPGCFLIANAALAAGTAVTAASGRGPGMFGVLWLGIAGTYAIATLCASLIAAKKSGWTTLPFLPVAFAAFHFSYGLGFLAGVISGAGLDKRGSAAEVFTQVTR